MQKLTGNEIGLTHKFAQYLIDSGFASWYDKILRNIIPHGFGIYIQIILIILVIFLIIKFNIKFPGRR